MASILIRNLPENVKASLRRRAARRGHSMEEEARQILAHHLTDSRPSESVAELATKLFGATDGVDLEIPRDLPQRPPPDFDP